jgi:hypothetical protein
MAWIGWIWTGTRWEDVAEGRTRDVCGDRLRREAFARSIVRNTHRAMTSGLAPTWRPVEAPAAPQSHAAEVEDLGAAEACRTRWRAANAIASCEHPLRIEVTQS